MVEVGGPWFRILGCLTCVYGCPGEGRYVHAGLSSLEILSAVGGIVGISFGTLCFSPWILIGPFLGGAGWCPL